MIQVAIRHGKPVLLSIDAKRMSEEGHPFFVTGNAVCLVDHVPPRFLAVVEA
jgi:putative RNA 2'-phosphotransferase